MLCFLIFNVIRGDTAQVIGGIWVSPEQIETLRGQMGLNNNIFIRYFDWLGNFIKGNAGISYSFRGESVSSLILQRLPVTLTLSLLSLFFIIIISFSFSLLTVKKEGGIIDTIANFLTAAGISTPGFFLGLLFIFIFGFIFKIFVPGNFINYSENFFGFLGYLIFPALAIAIPSSAILIKFLRSSLFTELQSDYARTARSKGANRFYVLFHHVLKNSLLPAITMLGMIIAEVFSGSIIIEQVFSIPGIGRLLIAAINSRDYPLIQALMIYCSSLVVIANMLADIALMFIDPRIRIAKDIR
ncbi:MAG: ABC transporter permease [Treponema sp.]|nr:ABC transporter permease [Treponema sp.]MCL2252027.1 ABC transporter permease [Treponema sp.]